MVFDIGGNKYRLIIRFDFNHALGFVRFVGSHDEYDKVDASEV